MGLHLWVSYKLTMTINFRLILAERDQGSEQTQSIIIASLLHMHNNILALFFIALYRASYGIFRLGGGGGGRSLLGTATVSCMSMQHTPVSTNASRGSGGMLPQEFFFLDLRCNLRSGSDYFEKSSILL